MVVPRLVLAAAVAMLAFLTFELALNVLGVAF